MFIVYRTRREGGYWQVQHIEGWSNSSRQTDWYLQGTERWAGLTEDGTWWHRWGVFYKLSNPWYECVRRIDDSTGLRQYIGRKGNIEYWVLNQRDLLYGRIVVIYFYVGWFAISTWAMNAIQYNSMVTLSEVNIFVSLIVTQLATAH